jgi:ATP-dependent Zn protease
MLTTPRAVLLGFTLIAVAIVLQPITLNAFIITPVHADWTSTSQDISFSQLLSDVDQGRVRGVLIQGPEIHGIYTDGRSFQTYAPSDPSLIQRLYNKGVQIIARPQSDNVPWFVSLLISCFVALIGVWIFLSRQMQVALSSIAHAIEQISALPVPRA